MNKKTIKDLCDEYLCDEPEEALRDEIHRLIENNVDEVDLEDRLQNDLRFGTAGLRARMEAGYNRMNRASIFRFGHAFASVLADLPFRGTTLVIGYDCRENSEIFARDLSNIFFSFGFSVHMFSTYVPTPLCAYAVKKLQALAGIMITASHNPKEDNGIKIFNWSGAQETGDVLIRIEEKMREAPRRTDFFDRHAPLWSSDQIKLVGDEIFAHYLRDIKSHALFDENDIERKIAAVYTPLHGVGKRYFMAALLDNGFDLVTVEPQQGEADSQFPTVIFPNPEEDNTLDIAHDRAKSLGNCYVLATDPDADRLQVSCFLPDTKEFRKLSGNEMGSILGYFAITRALHRGIKPIVATSIVSSRMLKSISEKLGSHYVEALTGFRNIVATALASELEHDAQFIFGYEEALGFSLGKTVLDKDGISAGVRFMEILGHLHHEGKTIWELLDDLYCAFGIFLPSSWSLRFDGSNAMHQMKTVMNAWRNLPVRRIADLVGETYCRRFDLLAPEPNSPYERHVGDVIIFEINSRFRFIVRPSGTEPKIKFYLELSDHVAERSQVADKKARLEKSIIELKNKLGNLV